MSRRGNYPISLSWDYYDDPKRGALGLRSSKNWRWLLTLLLLLLRRPSANHHGLAKQPG